MQTDIGRFARFVGDGDSSQVVLAGPGGRRRLDDPDATLSLFILGKTEGPTA